VHQFFVALVVVERYYRYPVVQLVAEGIDGIVYNYEVLKVSVANDSQVLDVDTVFGANAVVAIEAVLDELALRVEVVQDHVCVGLVARCEDDDLVLLVRFLQALQGVGTNVDASPHSFPVRKSHGNLVVTRIVLYVIDAMHQRLI